MPFIIELISFGVKIAPDVALFILSETFYDRFDKLLLFISAAIVPFDEFERIVRCFFDNELLLLLCGFNKLFSTILETSIIYY